MNISSPILQFLIESVDDGVYLVDQDRAIFLWNRGAARISGYSDQEMLGRTCSGTLGHVNEEGCELCGGSCPLEATMADSQAREAVAFLHHREGHRVRVAVRVFPIVDIEGEMVGAAQVFRESPSVNDFRTRMSDLERRRFLDVSSRLPDRSFLEMTLATQLVRLKWTSGCFGVVFVRLADVGSLVGNGLLGQAMRVVGETIHSSTRRWDVAGRWTDDTLMVVAPDIECSSVRPLSERLEVMVSRSGRAAGFPGELRVTVGTAVAKLGDDASEVIARAWANLEERTGS